MIVRQRDAWIDQEMRAASRPPVRLMQEHHHHRYRRWPGDVPGRRFDPGVRMIAQLHDLRRRLITMAVVCHARHPNQCLLAWAIGSFLVTQIMVGAVGAPLLAHFWPLVWWRVGVC
jgi:hypothetical protein